MNYPICPVEFDEIWKPITTDMVPDVLPYYSVSNKGRVFSSFSNKYLSLIINNHGYVVVCLHLSSQRKQATVSVHRLVLMAFHNIINPELYQVNHKNMIKVNNFAENLEWSTAKENCIHRSIYGHQIDISGSNNPCAKLNEEIVVKILNDIKSKQFSFKEIADKYNISTSVVESIAHRKSWKCINYDMSESDIRVSSGFTDQEIHNICKFFEENDINNKSLYPSQSKLFQDCFQELGLSDKYDIESKRKTLERILNKSRNSLNRIANDYNYNFIR